MKRAMSSSDKIVPATQREALITDSGLPEDSKAELELRGVRILIVGL